MLALGVVVSSLGVLRLATVARKLSLEPGLTWRFEYAPNRLDTLVLRGLDGLPYMSRQVGTGMIHHVGVLHAVNVGVLVMVIGVVGAPLRGIADLVAVGILSVELAVLPSIEVHEYTPIRVVGFSPITTKIHAFSALYAVVVQLSLGAAYGAGVAVGVTIGIGLLFSVPFVITQAVVVYLFGDEMTEDVDDGPGPTFLAS